MNYESLTYIRQDDQLCQDEWVWIKTDNGAWDGPRSDWLDSHQHEYFKNVKKFNVCVQAGGCQGMYPRLLAQRFKAVYTFEPDPLNFYCLVRNCQEDNIVKIQAALGNDNSLIKVNRQSMENTGMHTVMANGFIPQIQLDNIDFPELDLLCLDVEGYEQNVLDGAFRTIRKHRPVIVVENPSSSVEDQIVKLHNYAFQSRSKADSIFYPVS